MTSSHIAAVALGDEIEKFGSYFGYAAIVALGVLVLLYFAQAREVRRLREWVDSAPEREAALLARAQAGSPRRVVAQPQPVAAAQPASPQTAAAQQEAARKAAAAAVMQQFQPPGAPASAGTAAAGPPGQLARPAQPAAPGSPGALPASAAAAASASAAGAAPAAGAAAAAGAPAATPASTPGSPASGAPAGTPATTGPGATPPGTAGPSSSPPGTGAPSSSPPITPSPAASPAAPAAPALPPASTAAALAARQAATPSRTPAAANGSGGQDTHESAAARPAPLPDLPPRPPRRPAGAPSRAADERPARGGRVGLIAGGLVSAVVVVVLVIVLTSGGGETPPADNEIGDATPPAAAPPPAASPRVDRKATQVAVLNGTTQAGLAGSVANTIETKGFTIHSRGNNADQQIATTTVSYADGSEPAARLVAQIVGVPATAVRPIDANTAAAVAPEAKVVVIVGNDKSATASGSSRDVVPETPECRRRQARTQDRRCGPATSRSEDPRR